MAREQRHERTCHARLVPLRECGGRAHAKLSSLVEGHPHARIEERHVVQPWVLGLQGAGRDEEGLAGNREELINELVTRMN